MNDDDGERAMGSVGEEMLKRAVCGVASQPFSFGVTRNAFEGEEKAIVLYGVEENHDAVNHPSNHHVEARLAP